jgi:predicted secreted Zn-dependent protease
LPVREHIGQPSLAVCVTASAIAELRLELTWPNAPKPLAARCITDGQDLLYPA